MKLNRYIVLCVFLFCSTFRLVSQDWPILESDDPTYWDQISCVFGEIHGETSMHFHTGVDIDVNTPNCPARAVQEGIVYSVGSDCVTIEHQDENGQYTKRSKYCHLQPNKYVQVGDLVQVGTRIAPIDFNRYGNAHHLHVELIAQETDGWYRLNPFNNNTGWELDFPEDNYDPQINNIYLHGVEKNSGLEGAGVAVGEGSVGVKSLTNAGVRYARAHFTTTPNKSSEPVYNASSDKIIVWGNVGSIVNARDRGLDNIGTSGAGMTVQSINYSIFDPYKNRTIPKYEIEFLKIKESPDSEVEGHHQVFNTSFNYAGRLNGNDDYIEMRSNDDIYLHCHMPVNNIQSNGIWNTKAHKSTPEIYRYTPDNNAKVNDEALFTDGIYQLRYQAFDVAGKSVRENVIVCVDNFIPYIKSVTVKSGGSNGSIVYKGEWKWNGDALVFNNPVKETVDDDRSWWISVVTSEPMRNVEMLVFGETINNTSPVSSSKAREWVFTVPASKIKNGDHTLEFTTNSLDFAGNHLYGYDTKTQKSGGLFPKHQNDGTWVPSVLKNNDKVHMIRVGDYIPIVPQNLSATDDLPDRVELTWDKMPNKSHYQIYRNTTGNPSSNLTTLTGWFTGNFYVDRDANPGVEYYYWVSAAESSSGSNRTFYGPTDVGMIKSPIVANFSYSQLFPDYIIEFTDRSAGDKIETWLWDFGDGTTSTEQHPTHDYGEAGDFSVSLTVTDQYGRTRTKQQIVRPIYDYDGSLSISTEQNKVDDFNYEFWLDINDKETFNTYDVTFYYGDGTSEKISNYSSGTVSEHTYDKPAIQQLYEPSAFVEVKNEMDILVYTMTLHFRDVSIWPPSYNLKLSVKPSENYVKPGSSLSFKASSSNGIGEIHYEWRINTKAGNLGQPCDARLNTCHSFSGSETSNVTFSEAGDYSIYVFAWDDVGNQGEYKYTLNIGDVQRECFSVKIYEFDYSCRGLYEVPLGATIGFRPVMGNDKFSCMYQIGDDFRYEYPYVKNISWYLNNNIQKQYLFGRPSGSCSYPDYQCGGEDCLCPRSNCEYQNCYSDGGEKNVCITFDKVGEQEVMVEAFAGDAKRDLAFPGESAYYLGYLYEGTEKVFASATRKIKVVDYNSALYLVNKDLGTHPDSITAGFIKLGSTTSNHTIEPGVKKIYNAYNSVKFETGFHAKAGSNVKSKLVQIPDVSECMCDGDKSGVLEDPYLAEDEEDEVENSQAFTVSPNPSDGLFYVEVEDFNPTISGTVRVYDMKGVLILAESLDAQRIGLDISSFPDATYIVKIEYNEDYSEIPLLKQ